MMKNFSKKILGIFLVLTSSLAIAQFPNKPIKIVVPYQAGNSLEPIVRALADEMTQTLKQPVLIEYKPGASTTIGAAYTASSPPDGHTLFVNAASFLISAQLMPKLPYDPKTAFVPITGLTEMPHVLIAPTGAPYKAMRVCKILLLAVLTVCLTIFQLLFLLLRMQRYKPWLSLLIKEILAYQMYQLLKRQPALLSSPSHGLAVW